MIVAPNHSRIRNLTVEEIAQLEGCKIRLDTEQAKRLDELVEESGGRANRREVVALFLAELNQLQSESTP